MMPDGSSIVSLTHWCKRSVEEGRNERSGLVKSWMWVPVVVQWARGWRGRRQGILAKVRLSSRRWRIAIGWVCNWLRFALAQYLKCWILAKNRRNGREGVKWLHYASLWYCKHWILWRRGTKKCMQSKLEEAVSSCLVLKPGLTFELEFFQQRVYDCCKRMSAVNHQSYVASIQYAQSPQFYLQYDPRKRTHLHSSIVLDDSLIHATIIRYDQPNKIVANNDCSTASIQYTQPFQCCLKYHPPNENSLTRAHFTFRVLLLHSKPLVHEWKYRN